MWLIVRQREAGPDAPYWPGRRFLASLDAVAWPALVAAAAMQMPHRPGVVGAVIVAGCGVAALRRLRRALGSNHRYRFTTRRWGQAALWLVGIGLLLRGLLSLAA